jgi:eukaryotic-like serine/threonine-protein kinase
MKMTEPERVFGRYQIVRQLAQGGMGVVYLGRLEGAAGFSKPVIIKRVLPDVANPRESQARFIREAQILSHLSHPCIVGVLDFGRDDDGYAMVLEYMHGYDLGRWLKYLQLTEVSLPWEEALLIALRALSGLHYAHTFRRSDGSEAAVLHRDISPGNILIDLEGQVRLLDFGIARMAQGDAAQYKTREGVLQGKLSFLAPELFAGDEPSASSDTYSLAIVLYEMLTGIHPFKADNDSQTMWRVLQEAPEPLATYRADLPAGLEPALFRALEKVPEKRYESAEHFARALRALWQRDEADIQSELQAHVRRDFAGDLPARLDIEPLGERDRAWRSVDDTGSAVPALGSSHWPPALSSPPPPEQHLAAPALPEASWERTGSPASTSDKRWRLPLALALVSLLAGGAWLLRQTPKASEGRFIVVEEQGSEHAAAATDPGALNAAGGAAPPADHPVALAGGDGAGGPSVDADRAALVRQLARRQAAFQACVRGQARDLSGELQLTLSFEVAATGQVSKASLVPSAIEATEVGRCLLRVAHATQFQQLTQPLHFSLPLRTRAVAR